MHLTFINSLRQKLRELNTSSSPDAEFASLSINLNITDLLPQNYPVATMDTVFYTRQAGCDDFCLGLGKLTSIELNGAKRFDQMRTEIKNIQSKWLETANKTYYTHGFFAFAFDENDPMENTWQSFANTQFVIPVVLLKRRNNKVKLQVNIPLKDKSNALDEAESLLEQYFDPSISTVENINKKSVQRKNNKINDQWKALSQSAISEINKGNFGKIVISRKQTINNLDDFSISSLLSNLGKYYPTCTIHGHTISGSTLIAASPERILSLQDQIIQCDAIGGTIANGENINFSQPENKKLLNEHNYISQDIYQRLDPLCHSLAMPTAPLLMKLRNLYHLETPIEGILDEQFDVFDILKTLHPTPAVAGYPSAEAKDWLLKNEDYQRGWYTGVCGWLDDNQNGVLSVMLRCALIRNNNIDLFAGAGLVAQSDWQLEWQETELKMQTLLELV